MLNRIALLAALIALVGTSAGQTWNLERAISTALENNPDVLVAKSRIRGAEAILLEARSYGLPQVSLNGSYLQTDSPMMAFGSILNQRAFDFGLDFNSPGTIDNLNGSATVGMNLYSGGQVIAGKKAATAGLQAASFDKEAVKRQLIAATVAAYLDIRKAREAVSAVEAGVGAYKVAVSNARLRYDAGQVLKADLLSLEVQLAETQQQLLEARHFEKLAQRAFLFVLGLPAEGDVLVLAEHDLALAKIVEPSTYDFMQRPELHALREREAAAEQMVIAAGGAKKPKVLGFASYQYDEGWETGRGADSWMAGVSISLDLFKGGRSDSKRFQAEARLSELREYIRKAELGIGLEVEQARLAVELAKEKFATSKLALEQAEESAKLSRARYDEGSLLTAELIGVEGRLLEARMRQVVAESDLVIAIAKLRSAVGEYPIQEAN